MADRIESRDDARADGLSYVPTPEFHYRLPHRTPPEDGGAHLPPAIDWATRTWFRFNVLLISVGLFFVALTSPAPAAEKIGPILVVVPAAMIAYVVFSAMLFVCSFLPIVKIPFGLMRILYYRCFSRLIVERAPTLEMPVWF